MWVANVFYNDKHLIYYMKFPEYCNYGTHIELRCRTRLQMYVLTCLADLRNNQTGINIALHLPAYKKAPLLGD